MGEYKFTKLLKESAKVKRGLDALVRASKLAANLDCCDDESIILQIQLRTAVSCLADIGPDCEPWFEPGVVGERLRACDEAIEYVLSNIHSLRKDDYCQEAADVLEENCKELSIRAKALADHIRTEGLL